MAYIFLFTALLITAAMFGFNGYKADKGNFYSYSLFSLYGLLLVCLFLTEANTIPKSSVCEWGGNFGVCMEASG